MNWELLVTGGCGLVLLILCIFGLHRYMLVYLFYRHADRAPRAKPLPTDDDLPFVTIQLPMYNERQVAARIIDAAAAMDYPQDRFEIQVLDDSTDETVDIARQAVTRARERGVEVRQLRRVDRVGFKAGALAEGLRTAKGEFIAIFDADFIPRPSFLRRAIPYLQDSDVGMVQTRWEHLNRNQSLMTRVQSVLLDGHFVMEHGARCRSGRFMSFNGTAGVWRRACIQDSGGWQHDTLTEDLDLSYRAQLRGWRFLYVNEIDCPAELPADMTALKSQQHRWAKGGAQTCRKLLSTILKSDYGWRIKLEAFFHLTSCVVNVVMFALVLLLFPAICFRAGKLQLDASAFAWLIDAVLLLLATCSACAFYARSQRELGRSWLKSIKYLPGLMSLGAGLSLNNARAVLEGFFGPVGEFVRTPKSGGSAPAAGDKSTESRAGPPPIRIQPWLELGIGVYLAACALISVMTGLIHVGLPFVVLFSCGFFYVGGGSLMSPGMAGVPSSQAMPAPGLATSLPSAEA